MRVHLWEYFVVQEGQVLIPRHSVNQVTQLSKLLLVSFCSNQGCLLLKYFDHLVHSFDLRSVDVKFDLQIGSELLNRIVCLNLSLSCFDRKSLLEFVHSAEETDVLFPGFLCLIVNVATNLLYLLPQLLFRRELRYLICQLIELALRCLALDLLIELVEFDFRLLFELFKLRR